MAMQIKYDGLTALVNQVTGLGVQGYDSIRDTQIVAGNKYTFWEYEDAYRASWQCRKVCDYIPVLMGRAWGTPNFEFPFDMQSSMVKALKGLRGIYATGQKLANQQGGATVVRFIDDGMDASEPVNLDRIQSIEYSRVFSPEEIFPDYQQVYALDPYNPTHYKFVLSSANQASNGKTNSLPGATGIIHSDRIIRFRGAYLPPRTFRENGGWEESLLAQFLEPLKRYLSAIGYSAEALRNFEVMMLLVPDLWEKMATNEDEVLRRLQLNQRMMSTMRALLGDKEEAVEYLARQFRGVAEIDSIVRDEMIGASGLTKPQFYQEHPSGLAATGESERLAEANNIMATQEEKWRTLIEKDIEYQKALFGYTGEVTWTWDSLYIPTPSEKSDIRLNTAKTDQINIDTGIYTAEEVRRSRFEGAEFSEELTLDSSPSIVRAFKRFHRVVNMSSDEIRSASSQIGSRMDSVINQWSPIIISLLDKNRFEWTCFDARLADEFVNKIVEGKTVSPDSLKALGVDLNNGDSVTRRYELIKSMSLEEFAEL